MLEVQNLDIAIENDGIIAECQCECAAGMGPLAHCKYIYACLLNLPIGSGWVLLFSLISYLKVYILKKYYYIDQFLRKIYF